MDALADRGQQDHRGDADGDAEQGQETAQALRDDGADGEREEVGVTISEAANQLTAAAPSTVIPAHAGIQCASLLPVTEIR
jgi:hypothetical protein